MIMNNSTLLLRLKMMPWRFVTVLALVCGGLLTGFSLQAHIPENTIPGPVNVMSLQNHLSADFDMSQWVTCPPAWINVSCSQLDPGLNYGNPTIGYGCGCGAIIYGPYIQDNRVGCGSGTIIKTWNIWTVYGDFTCYQTINVTGGYGGSPHINWPQDIMLTGCDAGTDPHDLPYNCNFPTWWAPECSELMYTWLDEVYYPHNGDGICKKILRKWKVIDWCIYNVDKPWLGGSWTYTQLIKIKDQYPPTIHCPADLTVDAGPNCSGSYVHIPKATGYDPCGNVTIHNNSPYAVYNGADASGHYPPGVTWVTFWAKDACGNTTTCKTKVTVTDKKKPTPVVHHGLTTNLMCMSPEPMIEISPKWFDAGSFDNCTPKHLLKFSITPNRFTCYDRGYNDVWFTVTDQSGNSETVKTYIIISDNIGCCGPDTLNPPVIVCPDDITVDAISDNCSGVQVDLSPATATGDCGGPITITNNSQYATSGGANASGVYPIGTTVVTFTAKDKCNKQATCKVVITVKDGKKPTPVVFQGLAIALQEDTVNGGGTITLVPEWFDAGSFDNCTDNDDLIFSVSPSVYNCDSLGTRWITFTVTDESGNTEIVTTYIDIQDPSDVCSSTFSASIAGKLITENGDKVSSVDLTAVSDDTLFQKNVDGDYVMFDLMGGVGYDVKPSKSDNIGNGVSTRDLIILRNHIIGKSTIHSPYKLIAADVDNNSIINTQDLILLKKVILGSVDELPGNYSWKFVDANFIFDPFIPALEQDYPESVTIAKLKENTNNVSFIAVKLGDLNSNVVASATGSNVGARENGTTRLFALSNVLPNRHIKVDFKPETSMHMEGIQMAITFNSAIMKYAGIDQNALEGLASNASLNLSKVDQGLILISWVGKNALPVDPSEVMFSINFEKIADADTYKLGLDAYEFNAEMYDDNDNTFNIELINEKVESEDGFALFQNRPNPLRNFTTIGFNLPQESAIELSIVDINGRLVKTLKGTYPKGTNNIEVELTNATGVYYYILKAGSNTATKKLIVIK